MPLEKRVMIQIARRLALVIGTLCVVTVGTPNETHAQDHAAAQATLAAKSWVTPPDEIAEAVLAPRYLNVTLTGVSSDRRWFAHEIGDGPVPMSRFSKPFDELGGLFVDFRANRSRTLTTRSNVGLETISAADGSKVTVRIPEGARVTGATWSPNGSRLAFYIHSADATDIYVADPASGKSRKITRRPVLATMVTSFEWTGDGEEIATVLVPDHRSARPRPPRVPTGPQVKQTEDGENILRTYASLMATPYDEELLEWHATGQLAVISVDDRKIREIGEPAMIYSFDFAPDGRFARVETMRKPFSYIVPVRSFGRVEQIWDRDGTVLAEVDETELNTGIGDNRPSAPGVGGSSGDQDKREIAWRKDGAGLTFLQREPAPEEDDAAESEAGEERGRRADRVMLWAPPFGENDTSVLYESEGRMASYRFSPDYGMLFVTERPRGGGFGSPAPKGKVKEYAVDLTDPETSYTLAEYASDDFYANPGSILMEGGAVPASGRFARFRRGSTGGGIVQTSADGSSVFFYGHSYNEDPMVESPKNFIDRVEIRTGEKERIYESSNDGQYERVVTVLDPDARRFIVSRETPTEVAQSLLLADGSRTQLTHNVDYTPDLTAAPRERFTVERPDGFRFLVNVTLPPGYTPGTRLPAMFWFYPREYDSQESYDEGGRTFNKNAFPNFGTRSMQYLARLGYAVVEPDAPIVGKKGALNNKYEHDLRNNLSTVIDELDARGLIDRKRLGLGGHSYGAFSTVNAMVHTPFFKAGIAGDGNYNRTFTPLAFQNERRFLWDAKDVYLGMSPFLYANELTGALLMYHGLGDQNVGTDPDHSPRLFHALNGLGKEAAMYLYPFEDHGPATKETLLDLWARWSAWLDIHLADDTKDRAITQDGGM
jgi:dipeptidyl aminopeptidase/acylaminoacyl peptidase